MEPMTEIAPRYCFGEGVHIAATQWESAYRGFHPPWGDSRQRAVTSNLYENSSKRAELAPGPKRTAHREKCRPPEVVREQGPARAALGTPTTMRPTHGAASLHGDGDDSRTGVGTSRPPRSPESMPTGVQM